MNQIRDFVQNPHRDPATQERLNEAFTESLSNAGRAPSGLSAFLPRLDLATQDAIGNYFHTVREALVALHSLRPDQAAILVGRNAHSIIGGWNVGRNAEQTATSIAPNVRRNPPCS